MPSATHDRPPVVVLTGFLGSGKMSLLSALLTTSESASTAVIVNESGEIGLDRALMSSSTDNVLLLEAGCLRRTIVASRHATPPALRLLAGSDPSIALARLAA